MQDMRFRLLALLHTAAVGMTPFDMASRIRPHLSVLCVPDLVGVIYQALDEEIALGRVEPFEGRYRLNPKTKHALDLCLPKLIGK